MKICFVIPDMSLGGSAAVVHDLIKYWPSDKDELFLVCFFNKLDDRYNDLNFKNNLKIYMLNKTKTIDIKFLKLLKSVLNLIKPDVINSHLTATFYLKVIGFVGKCSILHTIHSEPKFDLPFVYRLFLKKDIRSNKIKLIGCCDYISNKAKLLYKVTCLTIKNGVQAVSINKNKQKIENINFLFVGRFDKVKNLPVIINAFNHIKNQNFIFRICGYGFNKVEKEIQNLISINKNRDRIKYYGKTNFMDNIYSESDVLILVSKREGLPITILEGIKFNLSFIVTDVGGICEYVKNDINGIVLKDNNLELLSKTIDYLLDNTDIVVRYQSNSKIISESIDSNYMANKYYKVLTDER